MTKYLFIINPSAGKYQAEKAIPEIERLIQLNGLDYDLIKTESAKHVYDLAYSAGEKGYDVVIAGGGDGTANEVVNALMTAKKEGKKIPKMGVIPLGRGNDFAASMGIQPGLEKSIQVIVNGTGKFIDIGQVIGGNYPQGMYFGNGVGIGFDTIVGFEAAKLPAFLNGAPAYVLGALSTLFFHYERPLLRIKLDNSEFEQACVMVTTMNGIRLGGTFMIAPESKPDDGLFSMLIVEQSSRAKLLSLLLKVMSGTHAGHPLVKMPLSSKVEITALKGSLPVHADGETICEKGDKITLINFPRQIELITEG
jgi:diacylglycerol kinase (ATP)